MNEMQQRAIETLKIRNGEYIDEIDILISKVEKEYKIFDVFETDFWELMNSMEKANSQIPFLPFNNAYCIKNDKFSTPTLPCMNDPLYGRMSNEFTIISEEYLQGLEDDFEKNSKLMREKMSEMVNSISELLSKIIASNSITKRLYGLETIAIKIESKTKLFWYPIELSKREYSLKGSFPVPRWVTFPQITYPFHRRQMINYDYLFKSKNIHVKILKDVKSSLQYINEYLPFAELIPLKESGGITITNNNTATPKHIHVGSENKFEGNISIGNEADVQDGN